MISRTAATLSCAALCSCASPRYERAWQATHRAAPPPPSGCWVGHWHSDVNGHSGKLRCLITSDSAGYRFHYQATWAKLFTGEFTINCPVSKLRAQTWTVSGSKDLGPTLGGIFSHEATLTPTHLTARYSAKIDHGTMHLERVP